MHFARDRGVRLALAFLVFLLLTLAWFAPLIAHLDSSGASGPADSTLSIRAYWAINEQGGTRSPSSTTI